jgi:hypothetical protein
MELPYFAAHCKPAEPEFQSDRYPGGRSLLGSMERNGRRSCARRSGIVSPRREISTADPVRVVCQPATAEKSGDQPDSFHGGVSRRTG